MASSLPDHLNRKRPRLDPDHDPLDSNGAVAVDLSLLEALEQSSASGPADGPSVELLDSRAVKKMVLSFERRLRDNLEARLKHPGDPSRFADSEVALHDELLRLHLIASNPHLSIPLLLSLNFLPSLLSLLSHDNSDIANDVLSLLSDLTDPDTVDDEESEDQEADTLKSLVDALVENNIIDLLVHHISRINEAADPDDATAIHNALSVVENMIEVNPAVADIACDRGARLPKWLLARIKVKEFDQNKLYASEILAILLQSSAGNQKKIGALGGVDSVLLAISVYKNRDARSAEEEEMIENLYDCLCCLLMPEENKERFLKAEGVELMIIVLKQKRSTYWSAIKALDFAMTKYPPVCERFVDVLGLKTVFAAFMGKIPVGKRNKREIEELEERIISLVASLFGGITRGSRRDRLLAKFVENEYEKIDRLMEFFIRYSDRVKAEIERLKNINLDELEMDEDELYNRKLEVGLYTLQLIAVILGHIWTTDHSKMRGRIELLLRQNKLAKQDVKAILEEYHDNIGDMDGPDEKEKAQARIERFMAAF